MKNKDKWQPSHYEKDARGRLKGTHMHKIIGHAYEKVITRHANGQLADVGCGKVPYYSIYKDLVKDNICIDWGWDEGEELTHLDHLVDLNHGRIPLDDNSMDTVLCTDVLEHISNPEGLFSEMVRILKVNGKLIVTVPFMYWVHSAPHDHHRYTRHKLEDFCKKNKLNVVQLEEYGGMPEILYDIVWKGFYYYNFPMKRFLLASWKALGMGIYKRKIVRKISDRTKEAFPLGYILVAQKV